MIRPALAILASVLVCGATASRAAAGQAGAPEGAGSTGLVESPARSVAAALDLPFPIDGPPPPSPPAVVARDPSGKVTIRAVRLTTPFRLDGRIDDAIYASVPAISDFVQQEPREGEPASEKTEVWVLFDRDNVYVSIRCWESDMSRLVANEMRRDNFNIWMGGDSVAFVFDSFYDRRNSVVFGVNPIGGRMDGQVTNERQYNGDWNPVWDVKTGRFDGGWSAEAAVPLKSLRYRPGQAQVWGFNVRRFNRWKNEFSYLTRVPASRGMMGLYQVSQAATLVGLEVPGGSRSLEIKPYVTSNLSSDAVATPRISNNLAGDVGVDAKYAVTRSMTADLTYNTDFAQVEADEQQVNLTRFNLFFPEKREFFLENQGTFSFGGAGGGFGGGGGGGGFGGGDTPILFYSRRIGLDNGAVIPLVGGGRLSGRVGRFSLGAVNVQTDKAPAFGTPATNFSVVRLKRDILRRSSVGLIGTARSVGLSDTGTNETYGADGTFSFFANLNIYTYWARSRTTGRSGGDTSYRGRFDYEGDRYGVQIERLVIGPDFNPEIGFVRRPDVRKSFAQFRFSPRPARIKAVRKFSWEGSYSRVDNHAGQTETRTTRGEFEIQFQNGDRFNVEGSRVYEFLPEPFTIAPDVTLPVAGYDYNNVRVGFFGSQQRRVSANIDVERGTFYDGHRTVLSVNRGRVNLSRQLSVEPSYSANWIELVEGSFATHVAATRVTYTMTPLMFTSALLQYNSSSHAVTANVRLRWEYRPGSELFVVYNEQRDTLSARFPGLANRAVIVKVNWLFRP